jgi:hypothetical protein
LEDDELDKACSTIIAVAAEVIGMLITGNRKMDH